MLRTGRTLKGASLLLSIALHATLLLGLLELRDGDPTGDVQILNVTLAMGSDSASQAAGSTPENPGSESSAEAAAPEPGVRATDSEQSAAIESAPPGPTSLASATAPAADAEAIETPAPTAATERVPLEDVRTAVERLAPPAPRPAPTPVLTTVAMAARHAELLTEQAASWATDIDVGSLPADTVLRAPDGQEFNVEFARRGPSGETDLEHVIATVTTMRDGATLSAELRMTRLAFSSFAQLIDRWDPRVQIHDDEIDGRFHANSEIYIDQSGGVQPTFHGKVTTARGIKTSSSRRAVRRDEMFLGGLETRARRIVLPDEFTPGRGDPVQRFDKDTRITFYRDGRYGVAPLHGPSQQTLSELPDVPAYFVAGEDAELHVSGVVNGQVLVYSPEAVVITGQLIYAADPFVDPEADDYLGLASDRSVEIAPPDVTGSGDLRIQAAIYAKRRFAVSSYRSRDQATLFIDGSVTAGSLTATEPRFRTKLRFDPRFDRARPPSFPLTDRYELTTQDAVWRLMQ